MKFPDLPIILQPYIEQISYTSGSDDKNIPSRLQSFHQQAGVMPVKMDDGHREIMQTMCAVRLYAEYTCWQFLGISIVMVERDRRFTTMELDTTRNSWIIVPQSIFGAQTSTALLTLQEDSEILRILTSRLLVIAGRYEYRTLA